jgi:hypothetical protein
MTRSADLARNTSLALAGRCTSYQGLLLLLLQVLNLLLLLEIDLLLLKLRQNIILISRESVLLGISTCQR